MDKLKQGIEKIKDRSPFDFDDSYISKEIRPARQGSMSQEIGSIYQNASDRYGLDFSDLVYGNKGFMKTKYPNDFPDFKGDVVYSEKYFDELDKWFKENTGMSLKDRENYVKAKRKELYGIDNKEYKDYDKYDGLPF